MDALPLFLVEAFGDRQRSRRYRLALANADFDDLEAILDYAGRHGSSSCESREYRTGDELREHTGHLFGELEFGIYEPGCNLAVEEDVAPGDLYLGRLTLYPRDDLIPLTEEFRLGEDEEEFLEFLGERFDVEKEVLRDGLEEVLELREEEYQRFLAGRNWEEL